MDETLEREQKISLGKSSSPSAKLLRILKTIVLIIVAAVIIDWYVGDKNAPGVAQKDNKPGLAQRAKEASRGSDELLKSAEE